MKNTPKEQRISDGLRVAASYDSPAQGAGGLAWDGTQLWLADFLAKELLCLDPTTMATQRRLPSHGTPAGLAWDGHMLWQSVFGAGTAVGLDPENGQVCSRAVLPEDHGPVRIAGLAWDDTYLWCGSQQDGLLYAMDVTQEMAVRTLHALAPLGGLTWDGDGLWVGGAESLRWDGQSWIETDGKRYALLKLDPRNGHELARHPLPFWPMGLTWDGTHVWASDSQRGKLHALRI